MDSAQALEFAFKAGLKVRGEAARRTAQVSLAIHASRTADPRPAMERDPQLALRAVPLLAQDGRLDLALQLLLWAEDGPADSRASAPPPLEGALRAYRRAKAWAQGQGGAENIAWIRDVPRAVSLREAVAERLLLCAQADERHRTSFAQAALEAELAELPRAANFGTIFRANALALSTPTVERTLAGLGALDPSETSAEANVLFGRLRAALLIEKSEAEGRSLQEAGPLALQMADGDGVAAAGPLVLHLACAMHRAGGTAGARQLLATMAARAVSPPRSLVGALSFASTAFSGPWAIEETQRVPSERARMAPDDLAAAAIEASRALRMPQPVLEVLRFLDPEGVGFVMPWRERATLLRDLLKAGAWAAVEAGAHDEALARDGLVGLTASFRSSGVAGDWEIFLRALLADEAARFAASGTGPHRQVGWDLAEALSRLGPGKLERAKLSGRIAFEFVRAGQLAPLKPRWLDPYFPAPRAAEAS
jgi:hypothetical protein